MLKNYEFSIVYTLMDPMTVDAWVCCDVAAIDYIIL